MRKPTIKSIPEDTRKFLSLKTFSQSSLLRLRTNTWWAIFIKAQFSHTHFYNYKHSNFRSSRPKHIFLFSKCKVKKCQNIYRFNSFVWSFALNINFILYPNSCQLSSNILYKEILLASRVERTREILIVIGLCVLWLMNLVSSLLLLLFNQANNVRHNKQFAELEKPTHTNTEFPVDSLYLLNWISQTHTEHW